MKIVPDCQLRGPTKGREYRGSVSTSMEGLPCLHWTGYTKYNTEYNREAKGLGDHNYCRNPSDHTGLWCYTKQGWKNCDPGDGSVIPYCDKHLKRVIETDILSIAGILNIEHDTLTGITESTIVEDNEFDVKWKSGYKLYLILTAETNIAQQMFENLLMNSPADLILQTVFSLMQGTDHMNLKNSDDIDQDELKNIAKHIFSFLEEEKSLKV